MNNDTLDLIKQQSILKAAHLLDIDVKKKVAMCYTGHDKNPSLTFNEKDGYFKCFGCDAKGTIIDLVIGVKKTNFKNACEWIMSAFDLSNQEQFLPPLRVPSRRTQKAHIQQKEYKKPNQEIYEWVLNLLSLSQKSLDYLTKKRGFSEDCVRKLEIKDIQHPAIFFSKLRAHFDKDALVDCGLLRIHEERFKNIWWDYVIIFPFRDSQGNINYMQGRRMSSSTNKYINLNGLEPAIYNSKVLDTMKAYDTLLICEGIPDTITAMQMGYNAIGILGATNFKSTLVESLIHFKILVVPDVDNGGETFLKSIRLAFNEKGKAVQKIKIPKPYNDLNEYYINTNHKLQ